MKAPAIAMDNERIVRRHVHAVALAAFFRDHPERYGQVGIFFETRTDEMIGPDLLRDFLAQDLPPFGMPSIES